MRSSGHLKASRCILLHDALLVDRAGYTTRAMIVEGTTTLEPVDGYEILQSRASDVAAAYAAYGREIYSFLRQMADDEAIAEDLAVATFSRAMEDWEQRSIVDGVRLWLFRIATDTCLEELRHASEGRAQEWPWQALLRLFRREKIVQIDWEEIGGDDVPPVEIRAALAYLGPRDRAVLILRESHDLTVEEIGRILGASQDAVTDTLLRARERLQQALGEIIASQARAASSPKPRRRGGHG